MMSNNHHLEHTDADEIEDRGDTTTNHAASPVFRAMSLDALRPAPAVASLSHSFSSQTSTGTKDGLYLTDPLCFVPKEEDFVMINTATTTTTKHHDHMDDQVSVSHWDHQSATLLDPTTAMPRAHGWARPARLTSVPMYHPVSLHHTTVPIWQLDHVLDQLMHSFRILSLQTKFVDRPGLSCSCRSMDQVELSIQLWKQTTAAAASDNLDEQTVLIEIQRTAGDAMDGAKYIRFLLDVLEQLPAKSPAAMTTFLGRPEASHEDMMMMMMHAERDGCCTSSPPGNANQYMPSNLVMMPLDPYRRPSLDLLARAETMIFAHAEMEDAANRGLSQNLPREAIVEGALEIVGNLLGADRYDARYLGLQSCVIMTDPEKSGPSTAKAVARYMLFSPEPAAARPNCADAASGWRSLHDRLFHLIMTGRWPDQWDMDEDENQTETAGDDIHSHAFLALTAVAQAITLLDGEDLTRFIIRSCCHSPGKDVSLMQRLTDLVLTASSNPHSAYLATHILALLCAHSQVLGRSIPRAVVTRAQQVGMYSHKALEMATSRLLLVMQA